MNSSIAAALLATAALPGIAHAQTSPSDFTSATRYDAKRRIVGTIAPDPDGSGGLRYAAVRKTYDADGRLVRVEKGELASWQAETVAPANWSGFTVLRETDTGYDAMDRKTTDAQVSGGSTIALTQYSYDPVGRLQCTQVRMDQGSFGNVPSNACSPVNGGGTNPDRVTKNVYDDAGQLVQVRRAVGTGLEQAYETYSYTPNGKQADIVDARGNHARMTYDGLDRVAQWQFPSTSGPGGYNGSSPASALQTAGAVDTNDYEAYGYDANDNRTSLRKRDGRTLGFGYDALNRITTKTVPTSCVGSYACTNAPGWATRSVYYAYDIRGRQTAARYDGTGGGDGVFNGYDGFGRLTSTTTSMSGMSRQMTFGYDADGDRTQVTYPDGQTFSYSYDELDRENLIQQPGGAGVVSFSYDAAGQHSGTSRGNGTSTSWGYDAIGRLTALHQDRSGSGTYLAYDLGYNPASQVTSRATSNDAYASRGASNTNKGYVVNGLNQYINVAGAGYNYDANGNLTSDGSISYVYDAENRLVTASNGTTLTYDPNGRLWQTAGSSSGTTRFLFDGDQLSAEYDGSGNLLRRYVHGTDEDDPLVWYEGSGLDSPRYYHTDHQGSVVGLSDANGNSSAINSYDEYGVPASGNQGRFQYTGQAWLPELGLYHYKARIYSPKLGRFLQTDPVGYKDQVNLYAYVANDPVNHTDPTGMYDCDGSKGQCRAAAALAKGLDTASKSRNISSSDRANLRSAAAALGTAGDHNGVTVNFGILGKTDDGRLIMGQADAGTNTLTLNTDAISQRASSNGWRDAFIDAVGTVGHETRHLQDGPVAAGDYNKRIRTETNGYGIDSTVRRAFGEPGLNGRQIQNGGVASCAQATGQQSACQATSRQMHPGDYQ